ncbi:hypothetical protein BST61_g6859 [Cercospora zeina]
MLEAVAMTSHHAILRAVLEHSGALKAASCRAFSTWENLKHTLITQRGISTSVNYASIYNHTESTAARNAFIVSMAGMIYEPTRPSDTPHECIFTAEHQWQEIYRMIYPAHPTPSLHGLNMDAGKAMSRDNSLTSASSIMTSHSTRSQCTADSGYYTRPSSPSQPAMAPANELYGDFSIFIDDHFSSFIQPGRSLDSAYYSPGVETDDASRLSSEHLFTPNVFDDFGDRVPDEVPGCQPRYAPFKDRPHEVDFGPSSPFHFGVEEPVRDHSHSVARRGSSLPTAEEPSLASPMKSCETCPATVRQLPSLKILRDSISSTMAPSCDDVVPMCSSESKSRHSHSQEGLICFGCGARVPSTDIHAHLEQSSCKTSYQTLVKNLEDRTAAMLRSSPESQSPSPAGSFASPDVLSDVDWDEPTPTFEWPDFPRTSRAQSEPARSISSDTKSSLNLETSYDAIDRSPSQDQTSQGSNVSGSQPSSGPSASGSNDRKRVSDDRDTQRFPQGPVYKKAKKLGKGLEIDEPVRCIWYVLNGRSDDKDARTWPSLAAMHRHMRVAHGIYLCEDCFVTFDNEEGRVNHKHYGAGPCFKSCQDMSCRRRISSCAARDRACDHLYTRHAQWLAAYQVVKVLHQDRAAAQAIRFGAMHPQQTEDEASQSAITETVLPPTDQSQDARRLNCSTPIEPPGLLGPDLSFDASSISRVNDLLSRVTQLEQQLAQSQSGNHSQEDEITSLRQSQARLQQLLTTACHELMSVGSRSLAEGSIFRRTMSVDAPNVLADVDRVAQGLRATMVSPLSIEHGNGARYGTSNAVDFVPPGPSMQPMAMGDNLPPQQYGVMNSQGAFDVGCMNTYLLSPPGIQFPQAQSNIRKSAMQQTVAGEPYSFGPINMWVPENANYPAMMPNGPGSDYHSQSSSGPRK